MEEFDDGKVFGVDDLKESEGIQLTDFSQFVGQKVAIDKVYRKFIKSKFGKDAEGKPVTLPEGQEIMAPVLMVETVPVTTITTKDGEIEIRASEMFSLREEIDAEGKKTYTWSTDDRGALNKFLKKMKVDHPTKLPKKIVQIITRPSKQGQDFLGFIKE